MVEPGEWAVALAGTPWTFLVLYGATAVDGFFPPVPSESVVIALAALSASSSGTPDLWLLGAVAAAGAFTGDQIAYSIGRRIGAGRLRVLRSERARRTVAWADDALAHRGAAFILGARFVPVGRVAVNMAAGTVGFSRRRFSALAAVAAVIWAAWSVALGVGAGHLLAGQHPLVGVVVGVAGGLLTGAVLDRLLRRRLGVGAGQVARGTTPDRWGRARRRRRGCPSDAGTRAIPGLHARLHTPATCATSRAPAGAVPAQRASREAS